ncbi:MAG: Ig-like domain-containing protein [Roseibium sp.]
MTSSPGRGEVSGGLVTTNDSDFSFSAGRRPVAQEVVFSYKVVDSHGGESEITPVTIDVQGDPLNPRGDEFIISEDTQLDGNVLQDNGSGPDFHDDGEPLTVTAGTFVTAQGGSVTILSNGDFTYIPPAGFDGIDHFSYDVSDLSRTETSGALVTVTPAISAAMTSGVAASDLNIGTDPLYGAAGDDTLIGGSGSDTFVFRSGDTGNVIVTDFSAGASTDDLLQFETTMFADMAAVLAAATDVGGDVVITVDVNTSVKLLGVTMSNLDQDDFQFI